MFHLLHIQSAHGNKSSSQNRSADSGISHMVMNAIFSNVNILAVSRYKLNWKTENQSVYCCCAV